MKYFVQEELERVIEKYQDFESYAESMWEDHRKKWQEETGYETHISMKYAYICGVYQSMLATFLYTMKDALEKLDELHPGEE